MATISDLKPSISEMSSGEAFELVKEIRFLRRQVPPKKTKKASKAKATKKVSIKSLTKQQRLLLIQQLEEM